MKNELATTQPNPLAIQEPSVAGMLAGFIERGVTSENVSAFAQLIELKERVDKREAEKAFNAAFVALQQAIPVIVAQTVIPKRGKYERFEDVMKVVGPLLQKNGFAVSFTNDNGDGKITETCHLMHVGGHSRANTFTVRVSRNADHETQADCKAATTAKRNALLNALNIVIRQDCLQEEDDAHNEGGDETIDQKTALDLKDWVRSVNGDEAEFLKFAGAESFETIKAFNLPRLKAALTQKQRQKEKEEAK